VSKPKAGTQSWREIYKSPTVDLKVHASDTTADFYRVKSHQFRPKYFYGETAWMDVQRYVVDMGDFGGWGIFN